MGFAWGAVVAVVAYGATAQAAPKAAGATVGTAGAGATAPSGPAPTGMPAPSAATPVAPDASAAPAPDTAPVPPPPPPAEAEAEANAEEEAKEREAARKRVRRRRAQLEAEAEADAEEDEAQRRRRTEVEPPPARAHDWRLVGQHFLVSAERVTNLLGWSTVQTVPIVDNFGGTNGTVEVERAGTDVSFLGSGGVSKNLFTVPRLAIDGMFANGLTLGGSISYMVSSGESQRPTGLNSKVTVDDPTVSMFVFAPRLGVMIPASPFVGVWLRGGISRLSASSEAKLTDPDSNDQITVTSTVTLVDLTLDPQLVFVPVPHVGITLGALLDIGVSGSVEGSDGGPEEDFKASSYGVTGGLVAIF